MPIHESGMLKVFAAESEHIAAEDTPDQDVKPAKAMADVCEILNRATGWTFRYQHAPQAQFCAHLERPESADLWLEWSALVDLGDGTAPGRLKMDQAGPSPRAEAAGVTLPEWRSAGVCNEAAAQDLGALVAGLISDRTRLERALGEREAELATGVPIVVHSRAASHLAERLTAVLSGGAESLGCKAAAMYLLDDETSALKLRVQWGLGASKLAEPARPLAGALADLEALCGHAVVLEDQVLMDLWKVPEPCSAAVCVPVSGPSSILGTLWFYGEAPRKFTATEINLAEILAGRLAAELDREALTAQARAKRGGGLTPAVCQS